MPSTSTRDRRRPSATSSAGADPDELAHQAPASASRASIASPSRSRSSSTGILSSSSAKKPRTTSLRASVLRDAPGHQVEQLLVVEAAGRAGVAGADDLAGLDLQVGHRVGPRAVGQHQVPVDLVRVGAGRLGPDQHVADPDGVRVLALQRAAVADVAAAVRHASGRPAAGARGAGRRRRSRGRTARPRRPGRCSRRWCTAGPGRRRGSPGCASTLASRPSRNLTCWACTASAAQSATVTRVSCAPSPTSTSTLSASVAEPVCSSTTRRLGERADLDDGVRRTRALGAVADQPHARPARPPRPRAATSTSGACVGPAVGQRADPVERGQHAADPRVVRVDRGRR